MQYASKGLGRKDCDGVYPIAYVAQSANRCCYVGTVFVLFLSF